MRGHDRAHAAAAARRAHGRGADRRRAEGPARRGGRLRGALQRPSSREDTLLRLMTDGLLLAEIQRDRLLRRYDTIIIDEAHERSLNIDFLLGYLKRILPARPDLKVIVTSATIDPERFAAHFGDAPIVEVSGRTYPGRGPLPRARRGHRPDRRDRRRRRRAAARAARATSSCSSVRRARDPRHRGRARGPAAQRRRDPAAVRAPVHGRAAARVEAALRPPRRARHQRRRDVADRPRHPLRRRPRHGADLALQRAAEGPAAADRADLAGLRRPAQGPLRPRRRRASRSACTPRRTSTSARASPTPRSCARASPR